MADNRNHFADLVATLVGGGEVEWGQALGAARSESEQASIEGLRQLSSPVAPDRPPADPGKPGDTEPNPPSARDSRIVGPESGLGNLDVLRHLGTGAFGEVLLVRDTDLDRLCALKLLSGPAPRHGALEQVVREGRLLARVDHPNVAKVYRVQPLGPCVGVLLEYIEGHTLAEIVHANGPFDAREACLFGIDLCRALSAVHASNMLHRDVKAENVMRELGGRTVLVDFGLGFEREGGASLAARLAGTPVYMAPELFLGQPASRRSDVYSLGVLLFYLVSGDFPVAVGPIEEIERQHEEGRHRLLHDLRPDTPASFASVVSRATEKDPTKRYQTAGEMLLSLESALAGSAHSADYGPVATGSFSAPGSLGKRRVLAGLGVGSVLVVAALLLRPWQDSTPVEMQASAGESPRSSFSENRARNLWIEGDYPRAIQVIDGLLEEEPSRLGLRVLLIELLFEAGYEGRARREATSLRQLATAAEVGEGTSLGRRVRAATARVFYQDSEAVREYRALSEEEPDDPEILYNLGKLLVDTGDFEGAEKAAREALSSDPQDPRFHLLMASVQAATNQPDAARSSIEEAARFFRLNGLAVGRARTTLQSGELETLTGDPETASRLFRQAAEMFEEVDDELGAARALHRAGDMANQLYRHDESAELYTRALPILQRHEHFRAQIQVESSLGRLELGRNNIAESEELVRRATDSARMLNRDRSLLPALIALSTTLVQSRETVADGGQRAQEALDLARRLRSPDHESQATFLLANALRLEGHLRSAAQRIEGLLDTDSRPETSPVRRLYTLDQLASTHLQAERLNAALLAVEQADVELADPAARAEAGFFLATRSEVYSLTGQLQRAEQDLGQAESLFEVDGLTRDEELAVRGARTLLLLCNGQFERAANTPDIDSDLRRWKVPWLQIYRAEALHRTGDPGEALGILQAALDHPSISRSDELRGRALLQVLGDRRADPSLLEDWREAERIGLRLTAAHLGVLLLESGEIDGDGPSRDSIALSLQSYLDEAPSESRPWIERRWDVADLKQRFGTSDEETRSGSAAED